MSCQTAYPKYKILDIEVDAITTTESLDFLMARAKAGLGCYVVKPYVEFWHGAAHNPELVKILNRAELSLPDGIALHWATSYLYGGRPGFGRLIRTLAQIVTQPEHTRQILPERIGGINFTLSLLERCQTENLSLFLLGATPEAIIRTAELIRTRYPSLNLVGYHHGYFDSTHRSEIMTEIAILKPNFVLVGMGFPRQERLMASWAPKLPTTIMIGEGGSFDYRELGGTIPKAPAWMQRNGLEWLWRLGLEPSRFKRQLSIPWFIWQVYRASRRPK